MKRTLSIVGLALACTAMGLGYRQYSIDGETKEARSRVRARIHPAIKCPTADRPMAVQVRNDSPRTVNRVTIYIEYQSPTHSLSYGSQNFTWGRILEPQTDAAECFRAPVPTSEYPPDTRAVAGVHPHSIVFSE